MINRFKSHFRRAATSAIVLGVLVAPAAPASATNLEPGVMSTLSFGTIAEEYAQPIPGRVRISPGKPFQVYENSVGKWTGQMNYSNGHFAWSLQLKPEKQNLVYGGINCEARISGAPGYHYSKKNKPADYMFHSSTNRMKPGGTYTFTANCNFMAWTNMGPTPATWDTAVMVELQ